MIDENLLERRGKIRDNWWHGRSGDSKNRLFVELAIVRSLAPRARGEMHDTASKCCAIR